MPAKRVSPSAITISPFVCQSGTTEILGLMAGSLAQEMDNTLALLLGYAEMALNESDVDSRLYSDLEHIHGLSKQLRFILLRMQIFSLRRQSPGQPIDLSAFLQNYLTQLRRQLPVPINLHSKLSDSRHLIMANSDDMHFIMNELCRNAINALQGEPGDIEIDLSYDFIHDFTATSIPGSLAPGNYAHITIADKGCGIPKDSLSSIFQCFYSAWPDDRENHAGLGLACVKQLLRNCHGIITVDSEEGNGCQIDIYLPVVS